MDAFGYTDFVAEITLEHVGGAELSDGQAAVLLAAALEALEVDGLAVARVQVREA